jgi:hypothetical protein
MMAGVRLPAEILWLLLVTSLLSNQQWELGRQLTLINGDFIIVNALTTWGLWNVDKI